MTIIFERKGEVLGWEDKTGWIGKCRFRKSVQQINARTSELTDK